MKAKVRNQTNKRTNREKKNNKRNVIVCTPEFQSKRGGHTLNEWEAVQVKVNGFSRQTNKKIELNISWDELNEGFDD